MKLRKAVAFFLLFVTLGTVLVACGGVYIYPGLPLTGDKKAEVEDAFYKTFNYSLHWYEGDAYYYYVSDRHYGTFNGYTVLFVASGGGSDVLSNVKLGKYSILFGAPFRLLAYKDGKFTNLKDAYEQGVFTDEQIKMIYEYHKKTFPNRYSPNAK